MKATNINSEGRIVKNNTVQAGHCIFPFRHKCKLFTECMPTAKGDICATSINTKSKRQTLKTYGYCPKKRTLRKTPRSKVMRVTSVTTGSSQLSPKTVGEKRTKKKKKSMIDSKAISNSSVNSKKREKTEGKPVSSSKKIQKKREARKIEVENKIEGKLATTTHSKSKTSVTEMSSKIKIRRKPVKVMPRALNRELIGLLERLEDLMKSEGEVHRARAYQNARESIMIYGEPILDIEQLRGKPAIGKTIMKKFKEYVTTGNLRKLVKAKGKPVYTIVKVYGIGPKRARQLVEAGVHDLTELRARQDELLNSTQKKGLRHHEDIMKRIPRTEINEYKEELARVFESIPHGGSRFEIVGSYRRGAQTSGDIDIIITNDKNHSDIFHRFIAALQTQGIIIEILSKGNVKSLTVGRLPGKPARRIDFMYSPPGQYAFAILYFTGSKAFNVVQRERALTLGYTMNEHGLYKLVEVGKKKKKKGPRVDKPFPDERSIFDFLDLVYKTPEERKTGKDVVVKVPLGQPSTTVQTVALQKKTSLSTDKSVVRKGTPRTGSAKRKTIKRHKAVNVKVRVPGTPKKISKRTLRKQWKELEKKGVSVLHSMSQGELCGMLRYAAAAYYNEVPVVSDNIYDILKEYGEEQFPSCPVWKEIGAPPGKRKVKLPYFMGSMDKIKPDTKALERWFQKYGWLEEVGDQKGQVVVSGKADGISVLYTTVGGEPHLYTRGGATEGLDISSMIPYLDLPSVKNIVIRGEMMVPLAAFQKKYQKRDGTAEKERAKVYGKSYKNPRNMVAGQATAAATAMGSSAAMDRWLAKYSPRLKDVDFVAYEVIKPDLPPSKQMGWLEEHDVITIVHRIIPAARITNELLSELLVDWRSNYRYETDGVIVVDDKIYPRKEENPKHAFAFKMALGDQVAEAKVVDVLWTASKDGYLNPVIQIEPVHIRGADIEFATAYNAKYIKDNQIGVGAVIRMIRSGDVIPTIQAVISPATHTKMPEVPWEWSESGVDAVLKDIATSEGVLSKRLEYFFKTMKVEGLGPGNVARLIKAGHKTIPGILALTVEELLKVEGFKKKTANKIRSSITKSLETATLPRLMAATNIFGRGIGKTIMALILTAYPNILISKASVAEKITMVGQVKGVGKKRAQSFIPQIPVFMDFILATGLEWKLEALPPKGKKSKQNKKHTLYGQKVLISGFRDAALKERIDELTGRSMPGSVGKELLALIVKDKNKMTKKIQQAKAAGIELMTPAEFEKKYM